MKITFSWWESEQSNHTSEWDVPYANGHAIRQCIDEHLELLELRRQVHRLNKLVAKEPTPNG